MSEMHLTGSQKSKEPFHASAGCQIQVLHQASCVLEADELAERCGHMA